MDIPPGFGSKHVKTKLCRLIKALYMLKQSPRAWFGRFSKVMKASGDWIPTKSRRSLFIKHSKVYADVIIVMGNDDKET